MPGQLVIPLFPLGVVLFERIPLSLNIFEPRYLRMIRECVEDDTGFGVVLIKKGNEVASKDKEERTEVFDVGTLANIAECVEEADDRLHVSVAGGPRFRVHSTWEEEDRLLMGEVSFLPAEPELDLAEPDEPLVELTRQLLAAPQSPLKPEDMNLTDARVVSSVLAAYLPLDMGLKQQLLTMNDGRARMQVLRNLVSGPH